MAGASEDVALGASSTLGAGSIEVRPSTRRKSSCVARFEGNRIVVLVPAWMPAREREQVARELAGKLLKRRARHQQRDNAALALRAAQLSAKYLDGKALPSDVRWVNNQNKTRWGSCTATTKTVRISARLRDVPGWVLDYVLVHELAHLLEPNHGPAFKSLVARYPKAAAAVSWLAGYDYGLRVAIGQRPPV
ncbi:MAG: YgjP-like metallopeptidase domain-containing protein [Acidimicrobiales bacterium]